MLDDTYRQTRCAHDEKDMRAFWRELLFNIYAMWVYEKTDFWLSFFKMCRDINYIRF